MSPSPTFPDPVPGRPGISTGSRLSVDSSALHDFSDTHRTNARMLDVGTGVDDAAVVDLAITFGLIGIEFLTAVVEFLESHRRNIEAAAAREERVGLTTSAAARSYVDCDCAAAEGVMAEGVMADRELTL